MGAAQADGSGPAGPLFGSSSPAALPVYQDPPRWRPTRSCARLPSRGVSRVVGEVVRQWAETWGLAE
eukprot:15304647-Alexandrium_andersonii.AAC.1